MSIKIHIAILLALVFGGKLLILDSGILDFLDNENLVATRPYCKKKKGLASKDTASFEKQANSVDATISIYVFCNPFSKLDVPQLELLQPEGISAGQTLHSDRLSHIYLDQHSPPPRFI